MVSFTDIALEHAGAMDQVLQGSEADESANVSKMAKHQEPVSLTTPTEKRCNRRVRLKPSKPSPIIVSTPVTDATNGNTGIENHVRELVENLKGASAETIREATYELRMLAKDNNNRILIASSEAINPLVELLYSPDPTIQEHAVTALLNLSISDNNKIMIANSEAIDPLIHVLQTGNPVARENSAATLSSLSKFEEIKIRIGKCGAIEPLIELLENGSPQGKKDATTALFNLSTANENRPHIVRAGAVKHLINLMDPATGMVDRATVVIANVATIPEGRAAIAQAGGIPLLVDEIELGSPRGKENAVAALWLFCSDSKSNRYCRRVLEAGAGPPLVALSMSGTARAKEKAIKVLGHLRNMQRVYGRRG